MSHASQLVTDGSQFFHDIFNASPIGVVIENLEGQPLFVNPAFCAFLGFSDEELRQKHCVDFSPREDAEKDWALFQQLKAGSIDHYQMEKRYFRQDGSLVWGRLSISLLNGHSSPLVLAMVEDITEKKKAEDALHESEERLRLAVRAARMFAYSWDAATDAIERSGESAEILGIKNDEAGSGAAISAMVHPDDKERLESALAKLSVDTPVLRMTYRIVRPDGTIVWLERNSCAYFGSNGSLKRIVGMVVDITERKQAKAALAEMTRKLIESQEQERTRIGRELHDDINQRLAMVGAELEQLLRDDSAEVSSHVQELRKELADISNDVQALSHELHSSKLEYLGVVAGIKSWCKEFAERRRIEIDFKSDVARALPLEIGVTLFRILQEALHNVIKHSGSRRVEVRLHEQSDEIHFIISDSGKGFDIEEVKQGKGLGLISMSERARLVNGTIAIDSKPMVGTTIHIRVPLESTSQSERATG
jgi:PAS domain S-box-containing protein